MMISYSKASKLLSDNPTLEDQLGFESMAEILCTVIQDLPEPPFTIGIFGEWGCGKTSLMRMLEERLQTNKIKTVWFNAWKYDGKEVIWNALIQTIFYTIKNDPDLGKTEEGRKLKKIISETASNLAQYAAKIGTAFIPGGLVKPEVVDIAVKGLQSLDANDEQFDFINKFESYFDRLVKQYLGNENKYLVVFIDDLDRCLPETAIEVMEALKLYLDRANCIFVIGTESSIIEEGIKQRYKNNERLSAKEYLEKIIQLPFVMRGIDTENALSMLDRDPYQAVLKHREDSEMCNLIIEGTKCNPRRLKRFSNTFWVLSQIAPPSPNSHESTTSQNSRDTDLSQEERQHLAKVLLLQMQFPDFYYALINNRELVMDLVEATQADSDKRERMLNRSETLRKFYGNIKLRTFLDKTRNITCNSSQIERWITLTKLES